MAGGRRGLGGGRKGAGVRFPLFFLSLAPTSRCGLLFGPLRRRGVGRMGVMGVVSVRVWTGLHLM